MAIWLTACLRPGSSSADHEAVFAALYVGNWTLGTEALVQPRWGAGPAALLLTLRRTRPPGVVSMVPQRDGGDGEQAPPLMVAMGAPGDL